MPPAVASWLLEGFYIVWSPKHPGQVANQCIYSIDWAANTGGQTSLKQVTYSNWQQMFNRKLEKCKASALYMHSDWDSLQNSQFSFSVPGVSEASGVSALINVESSLWKKPVMLCHPPPCHFVISCSLSTARVSVTWPANTCCGEMGGILPTPWFLHVGTQLALLSFFCSGVICTGRDFWIWKSI